MKKRRKLFFIFSLAAQLISYCTAVFMLVKKKKSAAGTFAAAGILGTLASIAILNLKDEPDNSDSKVRRRSKRSKNKERSEAKKINSASFPSDKTSAAADSVSRAPVQERAGGNSFTDTDSDLFSHNHTGMSLSHGCDECAVSDKNDRNSASSETENDIKAANLSEKQLSRTTELEKISKAIEILKHSSFAEDSGDFEDIEAELEAKLSE